MARTPSFFRRIGLAFSVLFNAERAACRFRAAMHRRRRRCRDARGRALGRPQQRKVHPN